MSFPLKVRKLTLGLTFGRSDKQYHILSISDADGGNSVVVTRWGKRGAWGQLQVFLFDGVLEAHKKMDEVSALKIDKGYRVEADNIYDCPNEKSLNSLLGPQYFYNIGADALKHLDASIDVTGVKGPGTHSPSLQLDEYGRPVLDSRVPRVPAEVKPTTEQLVEHNPMWGLF